LLRLTRADLRRGLAPAVGVIALALLAGLGGYFSVGSDRLKSAPAADQQSPFLRGVIQSVTADRLTLTTESGPLELSLGADAPVEALRPTSFDRITAGDWLNGGAIAHAQTLFALVGIVVIPPSQMEPPR